MAIRNINLGTAPKGEGGDTLRSTAVKINENFSDPTNAASRLIGKENGRIPLAENILNLAFSTIAFSGQGTSFNVDDFEAGSSYTTQAGKTVNSPTGSGVSYWNVRTIALENDINHFQIAHGLTANFMQTRQKYAGAYSAWAMILSTANTTKDSNGFLKGASPIVKVHADKVVLNEEAEQQNVTFKKNGIGDYTINTESGLSTDGWYIELPKDMNGNPKVAVTLSEVEGVITLKSYKRIFSMETFTFEPDLDTPLDIPTDRWIDIRLNEIPVEQPIMPSEPVEPYSEV